MTQELFVKKLCVWLIFVIRHNSEIPSRDPKLGYEWIVKFRVRKTLSFGRENPLSYDRKHVNGAERCGAKKVSNYGQSHTILSRPKGCLRLGLCDTYREK